MSSIVGVLPREERYPPAGEQLFLGQGNGINGSGASFLLSPHSPSFMRTEEEQLRRRQPPRFKDARGKRVTLRDPYELNGLRRYDVVPADAVRLIADGVGFVLPRLQRRGYLVCIFTFLTCIAFLVLWKPIRRTGVDAVEGVLWPGNLTVFAIGAIPVLEEWSPRSRTPATSDRACGEQWWRSAHQAVRSCERERDPRRGPFRLKTVPARSAGATAERESSAPGM